MDMGFGNGIDERLAVYGTLRPGRENHHHLVGLAGTWRAGSVRGTLYPDGWGHGHVYPGLRPDPRGESVPVDLLCSTELPAHLARLDAFEGEEYDRVPIACMVDGQVVDAWIYAIRNV